MPGRITEPKEVPRFVLFRARDEPSFITGTGHVGDCGMTAW